MSRYFDKGKITNQKPTLKDKVRAWLNDEYCGNWPVSPLSDQDYRPGGTIKIYDGDIYLGNATITDIVRGCYIISGHTFTADGNDINGSKLHIEPGGDNGR